MARAAGTRFRLEWDTTIKRLAALLSAGAAGVSILSFLAGRGTAGSRAALGAGAAAADVELARLEVTPLADTAFALGDTLPLTALAADARGLALTAAAVHWMSDDSTVAVVDSAGQVVARGPGVTSVTVAAGSRAARARIWVLPRVAQLALEGDSVLRLAEGETRRVSAVARDARGHRIAAPGLQWSTADREIAAVDTSGAVRAVAPGSTTLAAGVEGLLAQSRVEVMPVPTSLALVAGAEQRAAAGQRLGAPITVQVLSRSGRPVPNAVVRFEAGSGGRAEPDSALTDARGFARTAWILGPVPGRQRLAALVAPIDSPFVVLAEADPVPANTRITILSDSLAGRVGAPAAAPVAIQVTDSTGAALADLPVAWTALDGGSFAALDTRTDTLGQARAIWTFGTRAGRQRARVQVGNPRTVPPLRLAATVRPAPPVAVRLVGGGGQRAAAGMPLARPVVLEAVDSFGNPVAGAAIRLTTPAGGAADSLVETGPDGQASVRWTLSVTAGPTSLVARLAGSKAALEIPATAEPAAPAKLRFAPAPPTGIAGQSLSKPVQVTVTDRFGNPVPEVAVTFQPSAGRVSPLRAVTDERGVATTRWTLGFSAGKQNLIAQVKATRVRVGLSVTVRAPAAKAKPASAAPAAVRPRPEPVRSPLGTVVP
ncbi:MAG TPA: Ig-like domain-containing protein [Gemmatimonadales bacterium]|jgi:hypothetical protein|nr:Ig-like domain-containing protein [Gemmatimonadales bacterium]